MSKTIDNIKSGNYEVVDNQGVSVTRHFTQCLEKELADLEAKLAEKDKEIARLVRRLMATKCKDKEKDKALAIYKRALELENEERFKNIDSIWMIEDDNKTKFINTAEELINYFLDQAKEELEKGENSDESLYRF